MAEPAEAPGLERTAKGPLVLLFYDGYERRAREGLVGKAKSEVLRVSRYAWRTLQRKQVHTGIYTAFLSLVNCLERAGCDVRINDFDAARKRPNYPIGVSGYTSALKAVNLPNPAVFGPGDYGYPDESVKVARDDRYKLLLLPGEWYCEYYRPYNGDKVRAWPVGIDTDRWPDWSAEPKTLDFVVYDKIYRNRERQVVEVRDLLVDRLKADGHSVEILQYGYYLLSQWRDALRRGKAVLFLCEHETQGIAYQEALAAGVPVLAWDEGKLRDPKQIPFAKKDLVVSSVPYFDERCGMRFKLAEFSAVYPEFMRRLPDFRPRDYIVENMSIERAAKAYLAHYAYAGNLPV